MSALKEILAYPDQIRTFKTFILKELNVCAKTKSNCLDYLEIAEALYTLYNLPDNRHLSEARKLFLSIKGPLLRCEVNIDAEATDLKLLKEFLHCTETDPCMSPNLNVTKPLFDNMCKVLARPVNTMTVAKEVEKLKEELVELRK